MPMSDAVFSQDPKTTGIQQRSSSLSLTHIDFSVSLNLLRILCNVDDEIYNLTLRNVVFKVFHNLFTHSFRDWRASAHLYF